MRELTDHEKSLPMAVPGTGGQEVATQTSMSPEEWEINKSCELKNRSHKYAWDPQRPGTNWAQCVHCGEFKELDRKLMDGYDELGVPRK